MIIYENTKQGFMDDLDTGTYVQKLNEQVQLKLHHKVGSSEQNSWLNSLRAMGGIMSDHHIPSDAGVALEYNIPNTSKRVDFIISGKNKNKKEELVFIELKQWQQVSQIEGEEGVVDTALGGAIRTVTHPSYQVWSYTKLLQESNTYVQDNQTKLSPCAYLHNYVPPVGRKDPLLTSCDREQLLHAPVFRMTEAKDLREFIKNHIVYGDQLVSLKHVDEGLLRPSKLLQDCLSSMLHNNQEFVMIDDQKVIYEKVLSAMRQSQKDHRKRVIIAQGGPGTGKSVVAINLLVQSIKEEVFSSYVTKNAAPKQVYKEKLKGEGYKKKYIDGLFLSSGSFVDCENNRYGLLLCDEAHRLNAKSGMFSNMGENQIKEIIHAALTSVFFIDEEQVVTAKDIGSVKEIQKWVQEENALSATYELLSQFRCGGNDGYPSWLDNTLQIRPTANITLTDIPYDFRIVDSAEELESLIKEKNKKDGKSRLVAGYCWEWVSKKKENSSLYDIQIEPNFQMQWNLSNTKPFAIDPDSVNQVGCIHTTQGLEFSYVGVIIGEDLQYVDGEVVSDYTKRAKSDKSLNGLKGPAKKGDKEALTRIDHIIRNTYKTLMSRGMKGCYVYCCDPALATYLKNCRGK